MGHNDRGVLDRVGAVYVARIVAPPGDAVAEGAAEGAVAIETPEGIRTAEVAIGCMVRPQPGDEVSVLLDRTGAAIVQAVLRRPGGGPLTVAAEQGLTLRAGATSLNLHARHGAFLASDRAVALSSAGLDVRTSRGFAELARLGISMGARTETLMGLSGLGDLILTCNSPKSRNMSLGMALGEGKTLEEVMGARNSVSEGVHSATAVVALARKYDIEMPIAEAVAAIVTGKAKVDEAIATLLARPFRSEG